MRKLLFFFGLILYVNQSFSQVVKITHDNHIIYFDKDRKLPLYTFYKLTQAHLPNKYPRTTFGYDALIDETAQTNVTKYNKQVGEKKD